MIPGLFYTPDSVAKNYVGNAWTREKDVILKFLYLGYAAHLFKPFVKTESEVGAIVFPTYLTRSPNDPSFPEWWEENNGKWE